MRHVLTALVVVVIIACSCNDCRDQPRPPPPALSCGRLCNSNIECSGDILMRCKFCSFGKCSQTMPTLTLDAGVDTGSDSGSK